MGEGLKHPQALLAIAFEARFAGGGYVTAILAPITSLLLLNHAAELPFMDAIWASKEWHTALPRRCGTDRSVGEGYHSGRLSDHAVAPS